MILDPTGKARASAFASRRWILVPALLAAILLAVGAEARDYYACDCGAGAASGCTSGNDSAAGTSPATAWETYDRLHDATAAIACGDTLSFCMGGSFTVAGSSQWSRASQDCTSNPVQIGAYQPGASTAKPRITGGSGMHFNASGAAGYRVRDLEFYCTGACESGVGAMFSGIRSLEFERIRVDGFMVGVQVGVELPLVLRDSTIINNKNQGIIGDAGSGTVIEGNLIQNNGCLDPTVACTFQHALYFNNLTDDSDRVIQIRDNVFNGNCLDATQGRACAGNVVALRGGVVTVEGNVFTTPTSPEPRAGCSVVRMSASTDAGQICNGCSFSSNSIIGGKGLFQFDSWQGGYVENNLFYGPSTAGTSVARAAISHLGSPAVPPARQSTNPTIRNNSIILGTSGDGSSPASAIQITGDAGTTSVYSNAIRMIGSGPNDACLRLFSTSGLANLTEDYNQCHLVNPNAVWASYDGERTLTQYRAESPNGDHSREANPGFVAPPNDFRLAAGAAGVDTGHPTLSARDDHDQNGRPAGAGPDVGAYELGAGPPPPLEVPEPPVMLP